MLSRSLYTMIMRPAVSTVLRAKPAMESPLSIAKTKGTLAMYQQNRSWITSASSNSTSSRRSLTTAQKLFSAQKNGPTMKKTKAQEKLKKPLANRATQKQQRMQKSIPAKDQWSVVGYCTATCKHTEYPARIYVDRLSQGLQQ